MSYLFIPPMLASRVTEDKLLTDPRYVAEPKLDGQRAQVHVEGGAADPPEDEAPHPMVRRLRAHRDADRRARLKTGLTPTSQRVLSKTDRLLDRCRDGVSALEAS
jgi:hypothetical protein